MTPHVTELNDLHEKLETAMGGTEVLLTNRQARIVREMLSGSWLMDERDEYTDAISAAHPLETKNFKPYTTALAMVSNRRDKYALVNLVNWLLARIEKLEAK